MPLALKLELRPVLNTFTSYESEDCEVLLEWMSVGLPCLRLVTCQRALFTQELLIYAIMAALGRFTWIVLKEFLELIGIFSSRILGFWLYWL